MRWLVHYDLAYDSGAIILDRTLSFTDSSEDGYLVASECYELGRDNAHRRSGRLR